MTIASCQLNIPWAAPVFYASDEFDLYFLSNPASRHGLNISANPAVSAAIYGRHRTWAGIRGIQLEGQAKQVRSPRLRNRFWSVYRKKFPFVDELLGGRAGAGRFQARSSEVRPYRLKPARVWYLDNTVGFGWREPWEVVSRR